MVGGPVGPGVRASALLLAHRVLTLVLGAFWPGFNTLAVLLVFLPMSFVAGPLDIRVDTVAICFVIEPLSVIDVPIGVEELARTTSLVELPVSFVASVVRPDHRPASMP